MSDQARDFLARVQLASPEIPQEEAELAPLPLVSFRGMLTAKSDEDVHLSLGDVVYRISVNDIHEILDDASQPSPNQGANAVHVKVDAAAFITEIRKVRAGLLGSKVGLLPFAFALPSSAASYAVQGDVRPNSSITFDYTQQSTPVGTGSLTGDVIDNQIDYQNDNQVDQHLDP